MGTENRALVGDALELVVVGLGPYVDRLLADRVAPPGAGIVPGADHDLVSLLGVLTGVPVAVESADETTANALDAYARELQTVWDAWARIRPFDAEETYRALDTAARLLRAAGADHEADAVRDLATFPLAVFAARVLAEYVVDDQGAHEPRLPDDGRATRDDIAVRDEAGSSDPTETDDDPAEDVDDDPVRDADDHPAEDVDDTAETVVTLVAGEATRPVRLRAVNRARHAERVEDARAPASIRALRAVDPALPLVTWAELSDTITALLATGRLDPQVLTGFTRRSLDERARAAVDGAAARGVSIRLEHVAWVVSVLRSRYGGTARVTRAAATALVAEHIAELAPRAGVDPRRVRQDMMAWVDVERA